MTAKQELLTLIDAFLAGQERSLQHVHEIEDVLVADYLDTEIYEVLAEPLALYRPGAGRPYVDESELAEALSAARGLLGEQG